MIFLFKLPNDYHYLMAENCIIDFRILSRDKYSHYFNSVDGNLLKKWWKYNVATSRMIKQVKFEISMANARITGKWGINSKTLLGHIGGSSYGESTSRGNNKIHSISNDLNVNYKGLINNASTWINHTHKTYSSYIPWTNEGSHSQEHHGWEE